MSNRKAAAARASTKSIRRSCGLAHNAKTSSSRPNKIQEKKLLMLDLDETLVHVSKSLQESYAHSFPGVKCTYYVYLRPYVHKFLERVSQLFDVVIFTASDQEYADQVLDFLDPQAKLIVRRYYCDSGSYYHGIYVKDLRRLGVDLAKAVLVDNCPDNFRLQKDNGIKIQSWYFDQQDEELLVLLPFLERLAAADDARPIVVVRLAHCKNEKRGGGKQEKSTEAPKKQQGKCASIIRKDKQGAKLKSGKISIY
ncbi:hypothetical protein MKW98_000552 [Papaver atlanticum]|uniref:FCP1 homology domain-containing protein n=1 Tax=Papaver atlanticum TaxID=357466 RepID=A0AAD4S3V9_9MAGN|nr:hypothetical protein MKW98_000552 [Papaver atlanticum]